MQEMWVGSLIWEDPLQKGMATHSSVLALEVLMDRGACWATVHGVKESDVTEHELIHCIPTEDKYLLHCFIWIKPGVVTYQEKSGKNKVKFIL